MARRVGMRYLLFIVVIMAARSFAASTDNGWNQSQGSLTNGSGRVREIFITLLNESPYGEIEKATAIEHIDSWLEECAGTDMDMLIDWAEKDDYRVILATSVRSRIVCAPGVPVAEDPQAYGQRTILSLPVGGIWHVVQGNQGLVSHIKGEKGEYAWDFVINRDGYQAQGDANLNETHYCWGQPVLAPAPGIVVQVRADLEDHQPYMPNPPRVGNHVYIDHQNGEISLLYHLMKDSVLVSVGENVQRGQPVGLCGNTGISMFPHLHYQLFRGTLEHHEKLKTRFSAYYSWRGTKDQAPDREAMKLNVSGVPKRLENVVNIRHFLNENIHSE